MSINPSTSPRSEAASPCAVLIALALALAGAAARAQTPAADGRAAFRDCPSCPQLVRIAPGEFRMGSTEREAAQAGLLAERAATERPQHTVRIAYPFAIGRYEVTIAEYASYLRESGLAAPKGCFGLAGASWALDAAATFERPGFAATPQHPAVCLSPQDFDGYVAWLSRKTGQRYRFPSEAEWEYAARSGVREVKVFAAADPAACRAVNAGDARFRGAHPVPWPSFACDDGYALTAPVGRFAPNLHGMYDTLGNTAEFVQDCYYPSHDGAPADGRARRDATPCPVRLAKGGSFAGEPGFLRPAVRVVVTPEVRGTGFGLRVLRELP